MMNIYLQVINSYTEGQGGVVGVAVNSDGVMYAQHLSTNTTWLKKDLMDKYSERYPDTGLSFEWSSGDLHKKIKEQYHKWVAKNDPRQLEKRYEEALYNGVVTLW